MLRIVQTMGGEIQMMSSSGEGTTFKVFLSQADESKIETSDMAQYANMGEKKRF